MIDLSTSRKKYLKSPYFGFLNIFGESSVFSMTWHAFRISSNNKVKILSYGTDNDKITCFSLSSGV